ncbi:hypothetical protein P4T04_04510 [Bacillus badius]|uniref:hypothetical protein n=1 Tax=Bacillus badius TaxID=1455 RepID=UPI002E1FE561|nr:hypothetical protein [Bacillus badius]
MDCVNWFIEGYKKLTGKTVLAEQVGYEAVELAQEEIGYEFIPDEDLRKLPDPLLVETCVYDDEDGNEWIAGIVLCGDLNAGIYTFWTRNGESISRQFINDWREEA